MDLARFNFFDPTRFHSDARSEVIHRGVRRSSSFLQAQAILHQLLALFRCCKRTTAGPARFCRLASALGVSPLIVFVECPHGIITLGCRSVAGPERLTLLLKADVDST